MRIISIRHDLVSLYPIHWYVLFQSIFTTVLHKNECHLNGAGSTWDKEKHTYFKSMPTPIPQELINVNNFGHPITVILEMPFKVVSLYSKNGTNHYRPFIRNEQTGKIRTQLKLYADTVLRYLTNQNVNLIWVFCLTGFASMFLASILDLFAGLKKFLSLLKIYIYIKLVWGRVVYLCLCIFPLNC